VCLETKVIHEVKTEPGKEITKPYEEEKKAREAAEAKTKEEAGLKAAAEAKAKAEAEGKTAAQAAQAAAEAKVKAEEAAVAAAKAAQQKVEAELKAKIAVEEEAKKKQAEKEAAEKLALEEKAPLPLGEEAKGTCEKAATKAIEHAAEIPLAPAFTERELNAQPCANYLSSEGGTTGDHFSMLKEITPANVGNMKAVWVTQLDKAGLSDASVRHGGEMASIEYEGVLYYSSGTDDIFAVSVASGNILWVHPGEEPNNFGYILNGGGNRGLAIGKGRIYSAVLSGDVEALNQRTGALEWRTEIGSPSEGVSVTSGPLYYNGMVVIGPVGGEEGVRGFMEALNAENGEVIWKHYDIPAPGEFGHETWPSASTTEHCTVAKEDEEAAKKAGDTQPVIEEETRKGEQICNSEWERGGAVVWFAPTVDDKTGDLYYGTSNAAEDYYGENRYGADLWNCAVLALNVHTGELAWGYQEVHHDVWDFDQGNQPDMVELEIEPGKKIEAVAAVNKDGFVYVLNAQTGEPVTNDKVTEKSVPTSANSSYPTQPVPALPAMHPYEKPSAATLAEIQAHFNTSEEAYNKLAEEGKEPTGKLGAITVKAGGVEEKGEFTAVHATGEGTVAEVFVSGGVQYAVSSYNPESSTYVADGSGSTMTAKIEYIASEPFVQGTKWNGTHTTKFSGSPTTGMPGTGYAWVTAYNLNTGKILWQINDNEERLIGGKTEKEQTGLYEFGESAGKGTPSEAASNAGTTQTAGGVTFLGNGGGEEVALESASGKLLWKWELGNKIAASASVYEWNGHEYVTVYTSEGGDNLWTFALNGALSTQYSLYKTEKAEAGGTPTPTLGEHGYNPAAVEVTKEFLEKGPLPEPCAVGTCASHEGKEK
jgi:alcohol dehydrogenase (cytochrome c)